MFSGKLQKRKFSVPKLFLRRGASCEQYIRERNVPYVLNKNLNFTKKTFKRKKCLFEY